MEVNATVDRISTLPEEIVSRIVSDLCTSEAVRTSVLSKAWKLRWTSSYNIVIVDAERRIRPWVAREATFAEYIDRILLHIRNATMVRLVLCHNHELNHVDSWVLSLFSHNTNIEMLDIYIWKDGFVFSSSLLNGDSLRILRLDLHTFTVCEDNHFANITNLYLCNVRVQIENSENDTVSFTFPILQEMTLVSCKWFVDCVDIYAWKLRRFMSHAKFDAEDDDGYRITIFCTRLEEFRTTHRLENICLYDSAITSAILENLDDYENQERMLCSGFRLRSLLKDFSSTVEELELSLYMYEAIVGSEQGSPLPVCDNLRRLVLSADHHELPEDYAIHDFEVYAGDEDPSVSPKTLLELLHSTPSLRTLVIDFGTWQYYDYDALEMVPSCIISKLEEIEFKSFDKTLTVNLAKFLLENAMNLKRFCYSAWPQDEVTELLSTFPSAPTCSITFIPYSPSADDI